MTGKYDGILSKLSPPVHITASVLLVFILGGINILTGVELSFSIFYLVPIYYVTWYAGRWPGIFTAVLSAGVWLAADYLSGYEHSHHLIPIWNMIVRLFFFLTTACLLAALKRNIQRRRTLERIFFHDILNIAGSVRGFAELLKNKDVSGSQEIYDLIYDAADKNLEEIENQRTLANAEDHDLHVEIGQVSSKLLLQLVANLYRSHPVGKDKLIVVSPECENIFFESDQGLLSRVLGNMIKNALEATKPGGTVTVGSRADGEQVEFRVHNAAVISQKVQKKIFRKEVSTKAKGRGLGTYSIKILTEYLKGQVTFTSSEEDGTTFRASYPLRFPHNRKTGSS